MSKELQFICQNCEEVVADYPKVGNWPLGLPLLALRNVKILTCPSCSEQHLVRRSVEAMKSMSLEKRSTFLAGEEAINEIHIACAVGCSLLPPVGILIAWAALNRNPLPGRNRNIAKIALTFSIVLQVAIVAFFLRHMLNP